MSDFGFLLYRANFQPSGELMMAPTELQKAQGWELLTYVLGSRIRAGVRTEDVEKCAKQLGFDVTELRAEAEKHNQESQSKQERQRAIRCRMRKVRNDDVRLLRKAFRRNPEDWVYKAMARACGAWPNALDGIRWSRQRLAAFKFFVELFRDYTFNAVYNAAEEIRPGRLERVMAGAQVVEGPGGD